MRRVPRALARARRRLKEKDLTAPRRAENAYAKGLVALFRGVQEKFVHAALAKFDSATGVLETEIAGEAARVAPLYSRMALEVRMANREAAIKALGMIPGADLAIEREILIAREANIRLVENALREYAASVRAVMEAPENFGLTVGSLRARLLALGGASDARAELIARDQTLKLNGQINEARQRAAGVEEYTWSTVGDDRVRSTHRAHEGKVFRWDSPPSDTGHPGQDFQCRCVPIAVLSEFDGI